MRKTETAGRELRFNGDLQERGQEEDQESVRV